jgi:hypothetical protein
MEELKLIQAKDIHIKPCWKDYCTSCKKNHIFTLKSCPSCGVYETPQPKSEKVYYDCNKSYICDGCEAYQDHYAI